MHRNYVGVGLLAVVAGLAGCGDGSGGAKQGDTPQSAGQRAYLKNCMACHGEKGAGNPPMQPAIMGSAVVSGDARALARWVMLGERPLSLAQRPNSVPMPRFDWMQDAELAELLTYVRATFGGNASAVTAADIAAARQAQ
jgi:mono/diheme cytochrome c family protein